jgi:hypothetical protein
MQRDIAVAVPEVKGIFDAGIDRDVAWWQHVVRMFGALEAYQPSRFAACPPILRQYYTDTEALREALEPGEAGKVGETARAFGQWRAHVTFTEGENARKLEIVADALARLHEMRPRTDDLALLDDMVRQLNGFIYAHYRAKPPANRLQLRTWCPLQTLRYDLLPAEWRGL